MNNITLLKFEGYPVRTKQDEEGTLWFVAADVCRYFGIRNPRNVTARLEDDEKQRMFVDTPGGRQKMTLINESGLYNVIISLTPGNARGIESKEIERRREQAHRFKRWLTHEVLPCIRKYGTYPKPPSIEQMLADPDNAIRVLKQIRDQLV